MTAQPASTAPDSLDHLIEAAGAGNPRAVGRLISAIENPGPALPLIARALAPFSGRAAVIGLTGAPGVGKSTTVAALIAALRAAGRRVGVLAVDPSSPFSGGALLGDRIRMQEHALDGGVFIRSMATRGHLGGIAVAVPLAVRVLEAAGCDVVLIETVGVGQSEVEIAEVADATVMLLAPGMGDGVQAAKAGVLEVADLFVINKADRDGVQPLIRELRSMIALGVRGPDEWRPPILTTVAEQRSGIAELLTAIDGFLAFQADHGGLAARRVARAGREVGRIALGRLQARLEVGRTARLGELATEVAAGRLDPYAAADRLLAD